MLAQIHKLRKRKKNIIDLVLWSLKEVVSIKMSWELAIIKKKSHFLNGLILTAHEEIS